MLQRQTEISCHSVLSLMVSVHMTHFKWFPVRMVFAMMINSKYIRVCILVYVLVEHFLGDKLAVNFATVDHCHRKQAINKSPSMPQDEEQGFYGIHLYYCHQITYYSHTNSIHHFLRFHCMALKEVITVYCWQWLYFSPTQIFAHYFGGFD